MAPLGPEVSQKGANQKEGLPNRTVKDAEGHSLRGSLVLFLKSRSPDQDETFEKK